MAIDSLGGYRLLRKLGEGARAEVFLAIAEGDAAASAPVAIKAYRPAVTDAEVFGEIEALTRAAGEHALALLDVAPDLSGGAALVLERLPAGSLGRLLRDRDRLSPGEAVTILAPLAATVTRLHAAGVVHGGIRLDAVLFGANGSPVLACFGRSALIEPGLPVARLEAEPGVSGDLAAMAGLVATVLERADVARPDLESPDWLDRLGDRLFDLAEPEPVGFARDAAGAALVPGRVPGRLMTAAPVPAERVLAQPVPAQPVPAPSESAPPEVQALMLPEWLERMLPRDAEATARAVLSRLRAALRLVRPRVWVATGAVAAALVVALALVPPPGAQVSGAQPSVAQPEPSASPSATVPAPIAPSPVTGDDPVAALGALIEARERCIRDLSVLCLDDVGQPGSAALAADQQLIRALQDGGETPAAIDLADAVLVERLGDSAIVDLGPDAEPTSVLLMKGEAGWRIRDYVGR